MRTVPTLAGEPIGKRVEAARLCAFLSAVLCLATLSDCRPVETADVTCPGCPNLVSDDLMDAWAWVFTDRIALAQPVACRPKRGAQTWFEVPPEVEAEVLRQAREGEWRER